jgi:lysophospholipase L1-like esterase
MERMLNELRSHHVEPIFMSFCSFDRDTGRYDTEGPFEKKFAAFAQKNAIPMLRSDDVLQAGEPVGTNLAKYFIDHAHMNELGTGKLAQRLADFVPSNTSAH